MTIIRTINHADGRIHQADIYRDVDFIESYQENDGNILIRKIIFPVALVLTQECDLFEEYNMRMKKTESQEEEKEQNQVLLSVLMAPLYNKEHYFNGEHLSDIHIITRHISRNKNKEGGFIEKNKLPRYHFLEFDGSIPLAPSIVDYKHYFTVSVAYLEMLKQGGALICSIDSLHRDNISDRFAFYLARIGLNDEDGLGKCEPQGVEALVENDCKE